MPMSLPISQPGLSRCETRVGNGLGHGCPGSRVAQPGLRGYVATSLRCACTLIRMPSPMNSDTIAVPP